MALDNKGLADLPPLREVINAHELHADKKLGQNFLLDQNITDKIARFAGLSCGGLADKNVVEIGPGPGGLTRSLLKADAKSLKAIEFDPRAVGALQDLKERSSGRLEILQEDALTVDVTALVDAPRVIVANLPYNIATPLLIGWLKQLRTDQGHYDSLILMFQKEVAQRICAQVGDKAYGRLAVISQWLCGTKKLFDLSPSAFTPPPKVTSSVVQFVPRALDDDAPSFEALERVTAAAFGQRRKMIRSSLKDYMDAVEACGLNPELRAENLSCDDFIRLARHTMG